MPPRPKPAAPTLLLTALALAACEPPADPFGAGPVPEPRPFAPGVISTPYEDEAGITFSPDGREAYFARGGGGRGSPPPRIHVSRFDGTAWTEAEVAPFSDSWDETPFLTADRSRLLFSSRRDMPRWGPVRTNGNLWVVERLAEGWSEPVPLPGDVNKPLVDERRGAPERSESGPVLLAGGALLYSTAEDAERGADLYVADERDGAFVDARPLLLNSSGSERHPALSPDGRYLVFQAFRDIDAVGEDDLYVSERTTYGWGTPRPLPQPINSPANDGYPSFSPDGRYFFFASERGPGRAWSIYYVETGALGLGIGVEDP
ncbi:MAG TPA: hypothetical protein VM778_08825 [Gemmatimonadota bacterium]|nr:hypothetical protein [Gemmatimonadota bacterium]